MTVMNNEKRLERKPVLSLVGCWDEDVDGPASEEHFDQKPPRSIDSEVESFWAGRNQAARLSARIAA